MNRFATFLVFVLLLGVGAEAQRYGDTVDMMQRQPEYYYNDWWADQWEDTTSERLFLEWVHITAYHDYRYNYTDRPLSIVGLAAVMGVFSYGGSMFNYVDTMIMPEYLMLAQAYPDSSFDILRSVSVDVRDSHRFARLRWFPGDNHVYHCCRTLPPEDSVLRLYEYYFDKPVMVYDSFYVGSTKNWLYRGDDPSSLIFPFLFWIANYKNSYDGYIQCDSAPCTFPLFKYRIVLPDGRFYYTYRNQYNLIFPIVGPDTCFPVADLQVVYADSGRAELTWQSDGYSTGWELAWGPAGTPPDSCAIVLCDTVGAVLDSLLPDTHYEAYIRSKNEYADPTCYSEWSDPVEFFYRSHYRTEVFANDAGRGRVSGDGEYYGGDTVTLTATPWILYGFLKWDDGVRDNPRRFVITQDTSFTAIFVSREGIDAPDSVGTEIRLQPNPASGRVEVLCSCRMTLLEVVDPQGRRVLTQPADDTTVMMDISKLPTGLYSVKAHTVCGTSASRLMVK